MLIEQTCGNGSSVPQKVAAKLCFTQRKIKDMWETYCTKTPLQWLWKVLRNCSHEDTADSSEVQSSWEFGTCVTCNHWPVQWRWAIGSDDGGLCWAMAQFSQLCEGEILWRDWEEGGNWLQLLRLLEYGLLECVYRKKGEEGACEGHDHWYNCLKAPVIRNSYLCPSGITW